MLFLSTMSQDLLKEFGPSNQDLLENPWGSNITQPKINSSSRVQSRLDEDDFGDFEVPDNKSLPQASNESILLTQVSQDEEKSCSIIKKNLFADVKSLKHSTPSTAPEDDEWGDFVEDMSQSSVYRKGSEDDDSQRNDKDNRRQIFGQLEAPIGVPHSEDTLQVSTVLGKTPSSKISEKGNTQYQGPPPSNVPPPSILLLLVTTIFGSLPTDLKIIIPFLKPNSSSQTQIDQSLLNKLSIHLAMVRAGARIIAGRKLRWRRDNHLSQSMKIGPAHAGKAGGMKLSGIDRTETRREDREAEEAVKTWKQHLGVLRDTIAIINHHQPGLHLIVPEISETMPIRQAKPDIGAISAPGCCFLCGVKRDERVEKIDIDVGDSFGEWWTNHWGHVDCTVFWKEQASFLPQRR